MLCCSLDPRLTSRRKLIRLEYIYISSSSIGSTHVILVLGGGNGWDNSQSSQSGWDQGGNQGGNQGGWSQGGAGGGAGGAGGAPGVAKTTYYNKKTSIWPADKGNQGGWDDNQNGGGGYGNNQGGWTNNQGNNPSGGWDDAAPNKGTSWYNTNYIRNMNNPTFDSFVVGSSNSRYFGTGR